MHALIVLVFLSMCDGTSVSYQYKDIATKSKIELSPVQITCSPNDIIVLTTPVVNCNDALYRLHKPNGDILSLDFSGPLPKHYNFFNTNSLENDTDYRFDYLPSKFIVKYVNRHVKTMYPKRMYRVINVNQSDDVRDDTIRIEEKHMNKNDFMIGPLLEEDHGNWVLSVYCKDIDGEWIEMFQVITIRLITTVQMENSKVVLREGSKFKLSFKYPIKDLETCELTVSSGTPDRYFDRNRIELDKCGYLLTNITKQDAGTYQVIGVGRIVYKGTVYLRVVNSDNYKDY